MRSLSLTWPKSLAFLIVASCASPRDTATMSPHPQADVANRATAPIAQEATPQAFAESEPIEILALLDDPRLFGADPCPHLDASACYRVGWDLAHPDDRMDPRWDEAMPYLLRACELGAAFACSYLGLLHRFGVMAERDDLLALTFYERSCELYREPLACLNAGNLRLGHDEVPALDKALGLRWYELGCEAGDADSCHNRGHMNLGVDAQRPWYQRACELGDAESCGYLAGRQPSVPIPDEEPSASTGSEPPRTLPSLAPVGADTPALPPNDLPP